MKPISEKALGFFVLVSIALVVLAIAMLGSTSLFSQKRTFVTYFTDSVNGLNIGAPVKFRGVVIGKVSQVALQVDMKNQTLHLPIILEIDTSHFIITNKILTSKHSFMSYLIDKGLRARLKSESFITGVLYIELDFHPELPQVYQENSTHYLQIPTIPSTSQEMTSAFESAQNALKSVAELVQSKELKNALVSFNDTMIALTNRVDSKDLTRLIISASNAFNQADSTFTHVNKKVDPVMIDLEETLDKARNALGSFTDLTDYLAQHPESIIQGKRGSR